MTYISDILTEDFLSPYKTKKPNWGYNGLGEIVYKRTYSRLKDDGTNEELQSLGPPGAPKALFL